MNDRELLEAAAKAAGMDLQHRAMFGAAAEPGYYLAGEGAPVWFWWNPLTDDGDALRLAVALRLVVDVGTQAAHAFSEGPGEVEAHGGDPYAATRRAIVRAAAAMGAA